MSANSFVCGDALSMRARRSGLSVARAGTRAKKHAKVAMNRAQRHEANKQLVASLEPLDLKRDLSAMNSQELERYADWFLEDSLPDEADCQCDECLGIELQAQSDTAPAKLPSYLVGSLHDWMLVELEAANGDAFASLSLFESKSASPKAAISTVDDVMYA